MIHLSLAQSHETSSGGDEAVATVSWLTIDQYLTETNQKNTKTSKQTIIDSLCIQSFFIDIVINMEVMCHPLVTFANIGLVSAISIAIIAFFDVAVIAVLSIVIIICRTIFVNAIVIIVIIVIIGFDIVLLAF